MDLFADDRPGAPVGDHSVSEPGRTPPPARAPHTSGRLDLGAWDVPASPSAGTSRRWLLLAATVPWIVVAAIVATGPRAPAPEPAPTTAEETVTAPGPDDATPSATTPADTGTVAPSPGSQSRGASPRRRVLRAGTVAPDTRGQAVGLAAVVARSWLSTRPDGVPIEGLEPSPGADGRYVEHLVVESLDHPARGALVATVRAVVLPVEGDAYGVGEQVRLAVPISLDADHASLAGAPWPLAIEDVAVEPPTTAPVDDPDLQMAAAEAVMTAGYRDVALVSLERSSGWAWVAHVEARAPGQDQVAGHAIWLRSDVGRLAVAGAPTPAPADPPAAPPGASPSPSPTEPEVAP